MSFKTKPLASVIVPVHDCFRRFGLLKACLQSLCEQSLNHSEFEVIIVNNSPEEAHHLEFLLRLFKNALRLTCATEQRVGSYAARNTGIRLAEGEILAFLDSDCKAEVSWLESGLDLIKKEGDHFLVAGRIRRVAQKGKGNLIERHEKIYTLNQRRNVLSNHFGATANFIVNRSFFLKVGPFRDDLFSGGDLEWCHRAQAIGGHLTYSPQVIVRHQVVSSWGEFLKRYRRKAGGTYHLENLLQKKFQRNAYPGFQTKRIGHKNSATHPLRLLHLFIQGIQKIEFATCFLGKGGIRG
jgi:glycosyltransferase involved in cell wall biosynthesis